MSSAKYKVLENIRFDGKKYSPGKKPITLTDDQAAPLMAVGAIDEKPLSNSAASKTGKDLPTVLEFMISGVKEGATEKPTVEQIKKATGVKVSATERDEIWAAAQETKTPDASQ